jgi:hypothetical protein
MRPAAAITARLDIAPDVYITIHESTVPARYRIALRGVSLPQGYGGRPSRSDAGQATARRRFKFASDAIATSGNSSSSPQRVQTAS